MRILVTGSTSMIGKLLVSRLLARGDQVTTLQRSPSGLEGVSEVLGSVTDVEAVMNAMVGVEAVIHLAAKVDIVGDFEDFASVNVEGTTNLISIAREAGVKRFVHTSTLSLIHI